MKFPKPMTIVLSVVTLILIALGGWALLNLQSHTDQTPQTLSVVAAICLGLWNAWYIWAKGKEPAITAKLWFMPVPPFYELYCKIENTTKDSVYIELVTSRYQAHSVPYLFHFQDSRYLDELKDGELAPGKSIIVTWPYLSKEVAARYGFTHVDIYLGTGDPIRLDCKELRQASAQYRNLSNAGKLNTLDKALEAHTAQAEFHYKQRRNEENYEM